MVRRSIARRSGPHISRLAPIPLISSNGLVPPSLRPPGRLSDQRSVAPPTASVAVGNGGSPSDVLPWRIVYRRVTVVAQRGMFGQAPRMVTDPRRPVVPPGLLVLGGAGQPGVGVGRELVVGPELRLRVRWIDDARDVTRRRQHEPAVALEQLGGLVRTAPGDDVVVDRGADVGVGRDL